MNIFFFSPPNHISQRPTRDSPNRDSDTRQLSSQEGSVLVEKFASVEIYNKARLLLELIHMEFIGGEARDNGLLVAGQIKIYV
ncbi:BnaA08g26950D [Brassica napus]|uniref:BnaA08g26950D protein n=1 Tax=Brassica napus TaxID=3708 RepID=A0A078GXG3_BRANA|nr:BnaA08g26950D [Brassica napus]